MTSSLQSLHVEFALNLSDGDSTNGEFTAVVTGLQSASLADDAAIRDRLTVTTGGWRNTVVFQNGQHVVCGPHDLHGGYGDDLASLIRRLESLGFVVSACAHELDNPTSHYQKGDVDASLCATARTLASAMLHFYTEMDVSGDNDNTAKALQTAFNRLTSGR